MNKTFHTDWLQLIELIASKKEETLPENLFAVGTISSWKFSIQKTYFILYFFVPLFKILKMEITTFTDFRRNMRLYFEKVFNMGKPLFISRPKGHDVVLLSKEEYTSMQETFHLLRSPKNAERLLKAVEADKAGKGKVRKLLE